MNWLKLNIILMLLGGLLFLLTNHGQSFVSPQHYEKMKIQNQQKTRGSKKVQPQVVVKIQVQQSGPGQPQEGKAGLKQSPGL
ncbi:MAG: hypothetical protein HY787_01500 [Deltaproteobacteria bacterium]|nr:hypothetical protein [Deltaproteobacteria bacterium]